MTKIDATVGPLSHFEKACALVDAAAARMDCGESLEQACTWVWHRHATQMERDAVDAYLVKIQHPLAYEPGTQEQRFRAVVKLARGEKERKP